MYSISLFKEARGRRLLPVAGEPEFVMPTLPFPKLQIRGEQNVYEVRTVKLMLLNRSDEEMASGTIRVMAIVRTLR